MPNCGLEYDLQCTFHQPSELLLPKDGKMEHTGDRLSSEYEFPSPHSEQSVD